MLQIEYVCIRGRRDVEPRPLGPDTLCWDYVGEYRSLFGAGRALLQVAHPVVAERFGRSFSARELERFYAEWIEIGRLLAVDLDQLPVDIAGFYAWFERMIDERLEYNRVVADVIESLSRPPAPPRVPAAIWRPAGASGGHLGSLAAIGTLPPRLRRRWGLEWTSRQERELRAVGALVQATAERLPGRLRYFPYAIEARRRARAGVDAGARRTLAANA